MIWSECYGAQQFKCQRFKIWLFWRLMHTASSHGQCGKGLQHISNEAASFVISYHAITRIFKLVIFSKNLVRGNVLLVGANVLVLNTGAFVDVSDARAVRNIETDFVAKVHGK